MSHLITQLQSYGFSQKQAEVYLTCLRLGALPVASIARQSGTNRSATYAILKDLQEKGYITISIKGDKTLYSAISPEHILQDHKSKLRNLEDMIPDLVALQHNHNQHTNIVSFEGVEGMKALYHDKLINNNHNYVFLGAEYVHPDLEDYLYNTYVPERVAKGITAKVIIPRGQKNTAYLDTAARDLRETIMIDHPLFDLRNEIVLYAGYKTSFSFFSEDESKLSGVIIHNKSLYEDLKSIFDLLRAQYSS